MKCGKHTRYQVKRKPRGHCLKCWAMWLLRRFIRVEYKPKPRRRKSVEQSHGDEVI